LKLTIDSTALTEAALFAARAVNPRGATPVLTGLMLTAGDDVLTIAGFDGDKSATIRVSAQVTEPGVHLLPATSLTTILKVMPNGKPLTLDISDRATLKSGKTRFTVPVMPHDLYPQLPGTPPTIGTIDGAVFSRGVAQVIASAAKDGALKELNGIKVESHGTTLRFLATDRYRMSYADMQWNPEPGSENAEFLVDASTLDGVAKGTAGELVLQLSDGRAGFISGNRTTGSNLMAGAYPPVLSLFPKGEDFRATVPVADLLASVSRASVVIDGKNPVRLTFTQDEVVVDAGTGETSTGEEAVEATWTGENRTVGFNPYFLIDALKVIHTENVIIGVQEHPGKPLTFQAEGWDAPGATSESRTIIMPIKL
jgi:DNA polymerase-3 subunit beta